MKKIKKHITSEEEKRLIGHLVKKKKKSGKSVNVYFNKRVESTGKTKYVSGSFYSKKNNALIKMTFSTGLLNRKLLHKI